jgi:hypothetical protein
VGNVISQRISQLATRSSKLLAYLKVTITQQSKTSKIMKRLFIALALLTAGFSLEAQHETLFGRGRIVGGFGGPIVEMGLREGFGTSFGGGGGIVIGNAFIGGYGLGVIDLRELLENDNIDRLELGHGGFWLGFSYPSYKAIHLYTSARLGWGAVNIRFDDPRRGDLDQVFVATPEVGLELNLTRWFRVSGAAGYRWVTGTASNAPYTDADFSGPIAALTFRFGWFGNGRF